MLLSFNKCLISALPAQIFQSIGYSSKTASVAMCVSNLKSVCMYTIPRDSQLCIKRLKYLVCKTCHFETVATFLYSSKLTADNFTLGLWCQKTIIPLSYDTQFLFFMHAFKAECRILNIATKYGPSYLVLSLHIDRLCKSSLRPNDMPIRNAISNFQLRITYLM